MNKFYISFKDWLYGLYLLSQILRRVIKFDLHSRNQWVSYFDRSCREPASQFEKLQLLKSLSKRDQFWIETGTFMGYTTRGLSQVSKAVSSLEPSKLYFELSSKTLSDLKNVTLINATSEDGLLAMIDNCPEGSHINFWLDGHYSAGDTFLGVNHCPIEEELKTIESRLSVFDITVFIDDFRLFGLEEGYPTKDFLVDWGRDHGFTWSVEKDIFILSRLTFQS
jgi:hypothetical protein